jgi:hypothetical protein
MAITGVNPWLPPLTAIPSPMSRRWSSGFRRFEILREDIGKLNEPQFKAMFETAAEVLGGLVKAFRDYQQKDEKARGRANNTFG